MVDENDKNQYLCSINKTILKIKTNVYGRKFN